jgi:hypothetical protein
MSFVMTDATTGTQRFAVNNSQQTELGSATPSAELSVNGRSILSGSVLAQGVVAPAAMPRITGSVTLSLGNTATVSLGSGAGFASINGPGSVVKYSSDRTQVTIVGTASSSSSMNYGGF